MSNPTEKDSARQTDHVSIRRFLRAAEIVVEADRLDEFEAEVRRKKPAHGSYWAAPGQRSIARDLAKLVPSEFGSHEEIEAIALEHVVGSDAQTRLRAMETIAGEIKADEARQPIKPDPEPDPPGPPADWKPSYQVEQVEPIQINTALEVPAAVRLAQLKKGGRR